MEDENLRLVIRVLGICTLLAIATYILLYNFPLFGLKLNLKENDISDLSPNTRVKKVQILGKEIQNQVEDLVYFTTVSEGFDKAKIKLTFLNSNPEQEIHLGFKDRAEWHYSTKPVYLPLIENLNWEKTNYFPPILYQKQTKYNSIEEFLDNPPQDAVVGTYYLTLDNKLHNLSGYKPKDSWTKIDIPLRGSHTFYTYIESENFAMKVTKQDLNWYEGEDKLEIKVSKDGKILTEKTIDDDGVTDSSQRVMNPQSQIVQYEGGYPENGLYKVELVANGDTVIKSIETSFSLIVFIEPIFPIGGSNAYNDEITQGSANNIYTDANSLTFRTFHSSAFQKIKVNQDEIEINEVEKDFKYSTKSVRNEIVVPKGDLIIGGAGNFAFSRDQFFTPFIYKKYEVKNKDDLEKVVYLLTDYTFPYNLDGGWKQAEIEFDLKNAYYDKGKLSWIIKAPQLKEKGDSILIKDIEVRLEKDPIIK